MHQWWCKPLWVVELVLDQLIAGKHSTLVKSWDFVTAAKTTSTQDLTIHVVIVVIRVERTETLVVYQGARCFVQVLLIFGLSWWRQRTVYVLRALLGPEHHCGRAAFIGGDLRCEISWGSHMGTLWLNSQSAIRCRWTAQCVLDEELLGVGPRQKSFLFALIAALNVILEDCRALRWGLTMSTWVNTLLLIARRSVAKTYSDWCLTSWFNRRRYCVHRCTVLDDFDWSTLVLSPQPLRSLLL